MLTPTKQRQFILILMTEYIMQNTSYTQNDENRKIAIDIFYEFYGDYDGEMSYTLLTYCMLLFSRLLSLVAAASEAMNYNNKLKILNI